MKEKKNRQRGKCFEITLKCTRERTVILSSSATFATYLTVRHSRHHQSSTKLLTCIMFVCAFHSTSFSVYIPSSCPYNRRNVENNAVSFPFQLLKVGMHQLVLQDVTLDSSGRYMCQITESKPPFHTEQREKNLTVISESKCCLCCRLSLKVYFRVDKYVSCYFGES